MAPELNPHDDVTMKIIIGCHIPIPVGAAVRTALTDGKGVMHHNVVMITLRSASREEYLAFRKKMDANDNEVIPMDSFYYEVAVDRSIFYDYSSN